MGKCWILEETGEVRETQRGEYFLSKEGNIIRDVWPLFNGEYRILKLTECSSNPLEPIKEVWKKWQGQTAHISDWAISQRDHDAWQAIQESVRRLERGNDKQVER